MQEFQPCHFYTRKKKVMSFPWKGGRILRILREAPFPGMPRLSQKKLAAMAGVAPDVLKRAETQGRPCHIEDYRKLLAATPLNRNLRRQIIRALMLLDAPQREISPAVVLAPFTRWLSQVPWPSLVMDGFGDIILLNEGVFRIHGYQPQDQLPDMVEGNLIWRLFSHGTQGWLAQIETSPGLTLKKLVEELTYWFLGASIGYLDECYWWYRFEKMLHAPDKHLRKIFKEGLRQAWDKAMDWGDFTPLVTFRRGDEEEYEVWMDMSRIVTPYGDLYWVKYIPASRERGAFMSMPQPVHSLAPWPLSEKRIPKEWRPRNKSLRRPPEKQ